jgi:hypothetical protein
LILLRFVSKNSALSQVHAAVTGMERIGGMSEIAGLTAGHVAKADRMSQSGGATIARRHPSLGLVSFHASGNATAT